MCTSVVTVQHFLFLVLVSVHLLCLFPVPVKGREAVEIFPYSVCLVPVPGRATVRIHFLFFVPVPVH